MELKITGRKPQKRIQAAAGILALMLPLAGYPAWLDKSPGGAVVLDFAISPSAPATLFATATVLGPGVWRSTNSGDSWTNVVTTGNYFGTGVKTDTSTVVLAGIQGGAVQRSATSGDVGTWAATNSASPYGQWFFAFAPSNPNTVYAGGLNNALPASGVMQKSTDGGALWTSQSIGGDANPLVRSVAVHPTNHNIVYAGVQPDTVGATHGLYKTADGGASWTHLADLNFTLVNALAIDPNDPNIIYAGTAGLGQIKRSTDAGATWTTIHDPFVAGGILAFSGVGGIAVHPGDSRIIYAVGGSGTTKVIRSMDCGATWSVVDSTGIGSGIAPSKVLMDAVNNFVYVLENGSNFKIYREALVTPPGSGSCPSGSSSNNPPTAIDDNATATEDTVFVSVTDLDANDSDPDMDPLSVVGGTFTTLRGGRIVIATDGSYTYTPPTNFNGSDSVNYAVTDGTASDVATLNITVNPVDDPPVAVNDAIDVVIGTTFNSTAGLQANDVEVDGESLTVAPGTFMTAQGGSITILLNGSYSYTPAPGFSGADSFDYTVTDGISNDTGTLNITVSASGGSSNTGGVAGDDGGSSGSFGHLLALIMLPLPLVRAFRAKKAGN